MIPYQPCCCPYLSKIHKFVWLCNFDKPRWNCVSHSFHTPACLKYKEIHDNHIYLARADKWIKKEKGKWQSFLFSLERTQLEQSSFLQSPGLNWWITFGNNGIKGFKFDQERLVFAKVEHFSPCTQMENQLTMKKWSSFPVIQVEWSGISFKK